MLFAGIEAFFRDLSSYTLTEDVIRQFDENISILMCNMEKKFLPSFFDIMEHLVVHFPYEALLHGPVHNGLMYPYEWSMKHLKGKAKNFARVEGSIVAGSLNEKTYSLHLILLWVTSSYTKKGSNQIWWWWCYAEIYSWRCSRHILSDWMSRWETKRSLVVKYRRRSQCPLIYTP